MLTKLRIKKPQHLINKELRFKLRAGGETRTPTPRGTRS